MECGKTKEFILPSQFVEESGEEPTLFNVWASCISPPATVCSARPGLKSHVQVDSVGHFECCGATAPSNMKVDAAPSNMKVDAAPSNMKVEAAPRERYSGSAVGSSAGKSSVAAVQRLLVLTDDSTIADVYNPVREKVQSLYDKYRNSSVAEVTVHLLAVQSAAKLLFTDEDLNSTEGVKQFLVKYSPTVGYIMALTFLNTRRLERKFKLAMPNKPMYESIMRQLNGGGSTKISIAIGRDLPALCQQFVRVDSNRSVSGESCNELDKAQKLFVLNN